MTPCRIWTGGTNGKGYGQRRLNGKVVYVHRAAWEEVHGPIPPGLTVDHATCRDTLCYEVSHLELVTRAENTRRKNQARTHCKKGHPYAEGWVDGQGIRHCRPCEYARKRRYRQSVM